MRLLVRRLGLLGLLVPWPVRVGRLVLAVLDVLVPPAERQVGVWGRRGVGLLYDGHDCGLGMLVGPSEMMMAAGSSEGGLEGGRPLAGLLVRLPGLVELLMRRPGVQFNRHFGI